MANTTPFQEAIDFLKQKKNVPTTAYHDVWQDEHAKAFMVAGVTNDDMLSSLKNLVIDSKEQGQSIDTFRKRLKNDDLLNKLGWVKDNTKKKKYYNWRSHIIYDTNFRQSYHAGRWEQMQAVKKYRPYVKYVHHHSQHERLDHKAWNGIVLHIDDPWWNTHYPMNGWRCKCTTETMSHTQVENMGLDPNNLKSPKIETELQKIGDNYVETSKGVDASFNYNVGKASQIQKLADNIRTTHGSQKDWIEDIKADTWKTLKLDEVLTPHISKTNPLPKEEIPITLKDAHEKIKDIIGGDNITYKVNGLYDTVFIDSEYLAKHFQKDFNHIRYLPFLQEAIEHPSEVWAIFEHHKALDKKQIKIKIIKKIEYMQKGKPKNILIVIEERKGVWFNITFFSTTNNGYINKQRKGKLLYKK